MKKKHGTILMLTMFILMFTALVVPRRAALTSTRTLEQQLEKHAAPPSTADAAAEDRRRTCRQDGRSRWPARRSRPRSWAPPGPGKGPPRWSSKGPTVTVTCILLVFG
nr:uncharacterized protein LOC127304495 [Lolium perenne]